MLQINKELCTGCGQCIDMCPFGALTIQDNKAVVEESMCRLCGVCMNACVFSAMSMQESQTAAEAKVSNAPNANPGANFPAAFTFV